MDFAKREGGHDMKILITGGAGYIGSHTAVVLLEAGYSLVQIGRAHV